MNKIKIVTFDAFHTLVRPTGGAGIHYVKEASKYGIHVNKENIAKNVANEITVHTEKYPFYGIPNNALDTHFQELFNNLYDKFASSEGYEIYHDVLPTLSNLKKRGIIMGVISNSDDRISAVLKNLKMDHYFQFILLSCQVGVEKPSLEMYQKALMTIRNLSESSSSSSTTTTTTEKNVLHVGDDAIKDYQGAIHSGWNALWIDRENTSKNKNVPLDHTIHSFDEILPFIDK
ncbi:unnamed protein product [Cunninghamella blakesleeana]